MTTVVKNKKPLGVASVIPLPSTTVNNAVNISESLEDSMTVEQYLEAKFEEMVQNLREHADSLVSKLQKEHQEGVAAIRGLMASNQTSSDNAPLCVTLKCTAGPHIGQRFRLESADSENMEFKMGRSTGKAFKEKGVSLYKDKEISTSHAKIELRSGEAFLVDTNSTNGTQLNNVDVVPGQPYCLKDGDIIIMGSTSLSVHLAAIEDD